MGKIFGHGLRGGSSSAIVNTLSGRIAVLGMNVATSIIMARTLGPAGRGAASAISLWPVVLAGMVTLGVPVALRFNIRRRTDEPAGLLSVAIVISGVLGIVAALAGILLIPRLLGNYSTPVVHFAQAMMIFAPFMTVNLLLQAYLESKGHFAKSTSMVYLPPAGTLVALLALTAFHAINVFTAPLAYELPFSCITISTIYRLRASIHFPSHVLRRTKLLLDFGIRAYGLDVLNTLSAQIGQVVVIGLLSASSFGLYAVALNASRMLAVVGNSLNIVLFPKAAELEPAAAIVLVNRAARVVLAANVLAGGFFILAMPLLIRVAFGSAYAADIRLAQILTCEVIISATVATLTQAFMATNRPALVTIFQTIGLCTTFPLMIVLIPRFGLMGAAYALLLSTGIRLLLVLASYPVFLHHSVPRLIITRRDIRDVCARLIRPSPRPSTFRTQDGV